MFENQKEGSKNRLKILWELYCLSSNWQWGLDEFVNQTNDINELERMSASERKGDGSFDGSGTLLRC